jgi:hypothetical protein
MEPMRDNAEQCAKPAQHNTQQPAEITTICGVNHVEPAIDRIEPRGVSYVEAVESPFDTLKAGDRASGDLFEGSNAAFHFRRIPLAWGRSD